MGEQIKNMMVGLVMIAACAFTIALILFLKPSVGNGEKLYHLRFSNINGISEGTRVLFAGKPVGEVVGIQEIYDARKEPADSLGRIYFYELTIRVDSSVTIYNTDRISIETTGLLGEKSIGINPATPSKNIIPHPIEGNEVIYAQSSDALETAFAELSQLASEMENTFRFINDLLSKNKDAISAAIQSFKSTLDQANLAMTHFNESGIIDTAKEGVSYFSEAMGRADSSIKQLQDGQFFTNLADISTSLAKGEGTIGKLIVEDDTYLRITSLLSKANTMMNDINQYGILFHLNKTWQRERLQRITLMSSLDSPSSFKSYFEQEVESVNLAMERLSMLLEKAKSSPERNKILQNPEFIQDFAQFLREVNTLSDNVKLYNEQLMEAEKQGNN